MGEAPLRPPHGLFDLSGRVAERRGSELAQERIDPAVRLWLPEDGRERAAQHPAEPYHLVEIDSVAQVRVTRNQHVVQIEGVSEFVLRDDDCRLRPQGVPNAQLIEGVWIGR
jgi:hypothetical protein